MTRGSEAPGERLRRRLVSLPALALLLMVMLPLAPSLLLLALAFDLVGRRKLASCRTLLFLLLYLGCEVFGVLVATLIQAAGWLHRDAARTEAAYYRLQWGWARALLAGAVWLYGMRIRVEGAHELDPTRAWIVLMRHSSIADTLLPSVLLSIPHGLRLRYVLKRELLWDPCLDLVGTRLPNAFVRRDSADPQREIGHVRELARGLGPREGVLIYPEGSRFATARRQRVLARLRDEQSARLPYAQRLENLLPPRRGGVLALLEAAPQAEVLVCAHHGFEGARSLADLASGRLIGQHVEVEFWRIPREDVPKDADAQARWLDALWLRLDAWLRQRREGAAA